MPKKGFSAEQIVTLLRQIEVSMAQGNATPVACRAASILLQNYAMSCSTVKSSAAEGRTNRHRAMAKALHHDQTALCAQLSATGAADIRTLGSPPR